MHRGPLLHAALFATVLLAGCPDTKPVCDPGYMLVEDDTRCVLIDAGPGDSGADAGDGATDSSVDAAVDAGPRGMPCTGATPLCNATMGLCVACLLDTHCTDPTAAKCGADGECTACDDSAQCAGLTGTLVCATSGASSRECVECAVGEVAACGGYVCDSRMNTCTTTPPAMTGLCQACVEDAQCRPGQLCVPMMFGAPEVEVGTYCLWRQDATETGAPMGDCLGVRPYRGNPEVSSVDGVVATVCSLRVSTCEAHGDFDSTDCTTPGTAAADECGVMGQDDGWCAMAGATTNRCTVPCGSDDDCRAGFGCDTSVSPSVCSF